MLDSDQIFALLDKLGKNKAQFKPLLEKYIRFMCNLVSEVEELREEIMDFNLTYQMCITDLEILYWLKIQEGTIEFGFGKAEDAEVTIKTTRTMFVKMASRQISGVDGYMRGTIKAEGSLRHALRFIKVLRLVYNYIAEKSEKRKQAQ